MSSFFKIAWDKGLKNKKMPKKFSGIKVLEFDELKSEVDKKNEKFAYNIVSNFLNGNAYIFKNSFDVSFINSLKEKVINFWKNNPDTYHEMKEGCPDFHRVITPDKALKYYLSQWKPEVPIFVFKKFGSAYRNIIGIYTKNIEQISMKNLIRTVDDL